MCPMWLCGSNSFRVSGFLSRWAESKRGLKSFRWFQMVSGVTVVAIFRFLVTLRRRGVLVFEKFEEFQMVSSGFRWFQHHCEEAQRSNRGFWFLVTWANEAGLYCFRVVRQEILSWGFKNTVTIFSVYWAIGIQYTLSWWYSRKILTKKHFSLCRQADFNELRNCFVRVLCGLAEKFHTQTKTSGNDCCFFNLS